MAKTLRLVSSGSRRSSPPMAMPRQEQKPLGQIDPRLNEFSSFNALEMNPRSMSQPVAPIQMAAPQTRAEYADSPFNIDPMADSPPPTRQLRRTIPTEARMAATELRPYQMGEIIPGASGAARTGIGALNALTMNDEEFAAILKRADPEIIVDRDRENGGFYVYSPKTQKAFVINKPGLSVADAINFTSTLAAALPAGRAATMAGRAAAEVGIQSGIEGAQSLTGGEFNIEEPMLSGAFSAGSDLITVFNQARRASGVRSAAQREGIDPQVGEMAAEVSKRSTSGAPIQSQAADLSRIIDADPNVVRAAQELGLTETLPARVYSRNPQYVQVEQALANMPATTLAQGERQAMLDVAAKADEFISAFGGTRDLASLNEGVIFNINGTLDELRGQSNAIYDRLGEVIPKRARADTQPLRRFLVMKARDLGGVDKLNSVEQRILAEVRGSPRMTYYRLDELRQDVGELYGQQLRGNRFGDAATHRLKELYNTMTDTQGSVIDSIAGAEVKAEWDAGKALISQRKALEESATNLLGKEFNRAIIPQVRSGITKLLDGDVYQLTKTLEGIPEQYRQAAVVSAMDNIFTMGARNQPQLNMGGFSGFWKKLSNSPKAKETLMGYMPEGAESFLDNLAIISNQYSTAIGSVPRTGVVRAMGDFSSDNGFLAKVLPMIPVVGNQVSGVFSYTGPDAVKAASDLMGNADFRRMVIRGAQGNPDRGAGNALMRSPAFKVWIETLPPAYASRIMNVGITDYFFGDSFDGEENI